MENESNPLLDIIQSISQNLNQNIDKNNNSSNNEFNIMDIINNLNIENNSNKVQNNSFDISNIMKMQKIISALKTEDPRKNLLMTIKPFLRTTRQSKIDEYITCLSVITAFSAINDKKE